MAATLISIFLDTVAKHRKPALFVRWLADGSGAGRWESVSAERARADVESLALGLAALGVRRGDRVALMSETRYEWAVTDLAVLGQGAVTVPIYPTVTAKTARFILDNSEARACVVSSASMLQKLLEVTASLPALTSILVMDPSTEHSDPRVRAWSAVMAEGGRRSAADPNAFRALADATQPGDLATIVYTAGTTGDPKGVMLTHENISSNVEASLQVLKLGPEDSCLSFLPLSHVFERMAGLYTMLAGGCTIAYARGFETVVADAQAVRPTILCGVPRFYDKVRERVLESAGKRPPLERAIFNLGLALGERVAQLRFDGSKAGPMLRFAADLADRRVGARVRERVGGRVRCCISGGAPLDAGLMRFLFAVGIPVLEGYGLTETSPVICLNVPGRERPGAVGPPIPRTEVSFGPPEVDGSHGEILVRGPGVMQGYFRNETATREALQDGWFHTGDIGHLDREGNVRITGRKKRLIVTAGGSNVAPEPIERQIRESPWVGEVVVFGDCHPFCVAIIVPDFVHLEGHARASGRPAGSRLELLESGATRALYQKVLDEVNAGLTPYARIKKFDLLEQEFGIETGELTVKLEVRPRFVEQKFADRIERMYREAGRGRSA